MDVASTDAEGKIRTFRSFGDKFLDQILAVASTPGRTFPLFANSGPRQERPEDDILCVEDSKMFVVSPGRVLTPLY